jgi:hypothetical protein
MLGRLGISLRKIFIKDDKNQCNQNDTGIVN